MKPLERVLSVVEGHGGPNSRGEYVRLCPGHDDRSHPNLHVRETEDDTILLWCSAGCSQNRVLDALEERGVRRSDLFERSRNGNRKIVGRYDYHDAEGTLLFQAIRFEPKDFRQRRPDGRGGWIWNLNGVRPVLYRLPEALEAVKSGETVYLTEGEKDADRLRNLGLVATTNPMGAGKWRGSYSETLRGADVVIIRDNDAAGKEHAEQVARSLCGTAATVKVLELTGLADKGDASDWLEAGGTVEELVRLAREAPEWERQPNHRSRTIGKAPESSSHSGRRGAVPLHPPVASGVVRKAVVRLG
jgi:hypothetical protein